MKSGTEQTELDAAHSDRVYSPMPEHQSNQQQRQRPEPAPWHKGIGGGSPIAPKATKPETKSILDKLRRVRPEQARRYVQRQGE